jgi:hypothetical protein
VHRYVDWITRHPRLVIGVPLVLTMFLGYRLSALKVIIDMNTMVPQSHPYVSASLDVERIFGAEERSSSAFRPGKATSSSRAFWRRSSVLPTPSRTCWARSRTTS